LNDLVQLLLDASYQAPDLIEAEHEDEAEDECACPYRNGIMVHDGSCFSSF
jgi:hypothetical protein